MTGQRTRPGRSRLLVQLADHDAAQHTLDDGLANGPGLLDVLVVGADQAVVGDR